MSKDGLCRPSADRNKGNMTLTVWTGWTTSSAALQAAAAVADFSAVETNYRFRKLIHSSTIANWHVFFSGLALALETSSESLLPSEGNRSGDALQRQIV